MSDRKAQILAELCRIDGATPGQDTAIGKHRRMAENPFRFLRGAAQLFYSDLAGGVLQLPGALTEAVPLTTVMGDCHIGSGFHTGHAATRTALRSGRRVSSTAGPHRSLSASERS